jgi:hypothetical protein
MDLPTSDQRHDGFQQISSTCRLHRLLHCVDYALEEEEAAALILKRVHCQLNLV